MLITKTKHGGCTVLISGETSPKLRIHELGSKYEFVLPKLRLMFTLSISPTESALRGRMIEPFFKCINPRTFLIGMRDTLGEVK